MNSEDVHRANFRASMNSLEPGDEVSWTRNGTTLRAVVIERHESNDESGPRFHITKPATLIMTAPHPKEVRIDGDDWLVDSSGAVVIMPEEWVSTERRIAQDIVQNALKQLARDELGKKCAVVHAILRDTQKSMQDSSREILAVMDIAHPTEDAVHILAYTLHIAAEQVWRS